MSRGVNHGLVIFIALGAFFLGAGLSFYLVQFYMLPDFYATYSERIQQSNDLVGNIIARQSMELENYTTKIEKLESEKEEMNILLEAYAKEIRESDQVIRDLELEREILKTDNGYMLIGDCDHQKKIFSEENVRSMVDPGNIRNLAVAIVSSGREGPLITLYQFVRTKIRYVKDPASEYVANACETIYSGGGDCEDHAILMASLLESVGIDARIVWFPGDHAFVAAEYGPDIDKYMGEHLECGKPSAIYLRGRRYILLDSTVSLCPGTIDDEFFGSGEWKKEPVIFDV